ncbi:MAG: lytic transglycosylase domain-containing protein [Gemmatimonadales bacterium]
MSMLTMRQALARHQAAVERWASSAALFSLATLAVVEVVRSPTVITVRPAAAAISTPVHATSTALPALSAVFAAAPTSSPETTSHTKPASVPTASKRQLADISNPRVTRWVHTFTTSLRGDLAAALQRGKSYVPMISTKLAARGMPQELAYLPLIESNYKPTARSRVSAVGLWQFMAGTARTFGLSVGRHSDQRKNPAKETDAALNYLSQLHKQFGSWYLAAAAYNAGPGTIARAMKRVLGRTTGSDADFYRISGHLPAETREYVPKLVAAARIGKDPAKYGLPG